MPNRELTYLEAVRESLKQLLEHHPESFIIGEDVGVYGGGFGATKGLISQFPNQVLETPISEAAITGVAIGSAMLGKRPIVEIQFSDFLTVAIDQIVNQAAKLHYTSHGQVSLPIVIRTASGAGTGAGTQHSQSLEAWFAHVPGLVVAMPSNAYDVKGILQAALENNNPVIVFEPKSLYKKTAIVPEEPYQIPLGQARVVQEGSDLTIVALGAMIDLVKEAAHKSKTSIEIIDPITISPLDTKTILQSANKTGRVLIVTESYAQFGVSAEIVSQLIESGFKGDIKRLGSQRTPIPAAQSLEAAVLPDVDNILEAIEGFHYGSHH